MSETPAEQPKAAPGELRLSVRQRRALEWVGLIVVAVTVAILVKSFFVQSFYIPSGSMEPGLQINDRIIVEKPSYWSGGPEVGDVIVFEDPGDWLGEQEEDHSSWFRRLFSHIGILPTGGHLVKRVIGTPGDTVVCCDDKGRISVNGDPLDEPYIAPQSNCNGPMAGCGGWQVTVPKGRYFVLGDNRGSSADSSYHLAQLCQQLNQPMDGTCEPDDAFVPRDNIVGKAVFVMWPLGHMGKVH